MFYMLLLKGVLYTLFFDSGGRAPCHGIVLDTCLRGFVQFAFSRTITVKIVIVKKTCAEGNHRYNEGAMRTWFVQSLKIGAILAFMGALVWFAIGGCMVGYRMHWKGECEEVIGTVTAHEPGNSQTDLSETSQTLYTVFQYEQPHTHESKTGRSSVAAYPPSYAIGDKVRVLVHPDAPDEAKIDSYGELYFLPTALMSLGMMLLMMGLVFLYIYHKLSRTKV